MRPQERGWFREFVARASPAEFLVGDVALVTIRISEIVLARLGEPIELVLGYIFRQPIAAVFGEIELPEHRMPVHADDLPNPARYDFRAAAVEIDTAELRVGGRRHADIARCTDVEIELVVGTDGEEFPAVRLVLGQIVVDNDWLGRVIEVVLDLLNLRDLRELGDVEGAVGESEAVRAIESRVQRLGLAFAGLVSDGVDLVQDTAAHEHGTLVALAQRTRIGETACIEFDLKTLGRFQLLGR